MVMMMIPKVDNSNCSNWRSGLSLTCRQKVVKHIMETLQRNMPRTRQDCMGELLKISCRFEKKIFLCATDQQDYVRKIAFKLLSWERRGEPAPATDIQGRVRNLTLENEVKEPFDNSSNDYELLRGYFVQTRESQQLLPQPREETLNGSGMQSAPGLGSIASSLTEFQAASTALLG